MPDNEELYSGAFTLMTLTSGTETDKNYFYLTAEDAYKVDGIEKEGWFNEDMDTRMSGDNAVTFTPGQGFLIISDLDNSRITFTGKVAKGDTIIKLSSGANFCGNNALTKLDIQSIEVGTDCDENGVLSFTTEQLYTGAFTLMTLTSGTETDKNYFYLTAEDAYKVDGIEKEGWFNEDMDMRMSGDNAVVFDSGDGFLVVSDFDVAYVKIPGNIID